MIRRLWILITLGLLGALGLGVSFGIVLSRGVAPSSEGRTVLLEREGDNVRTLDLPTGMEAPDSPALTGITTQMPYCYQPDPNEDVCYINFRQNSVLAGIDKSMFGMTVTIGGEIRVLYRGFFDSSLIATSGMHGDGFKVPCGAPGDGEVPSMGASYSLYIIAEENATGVKSANSGIIRCPPYIP
jgi:hypothetical protein